MLQDMSTSILKEKDRITACTDYEKDTCDFNSKEIKGEISPSSSVTIESILMISRTEGYSIWVQELLIFRFFSKIKDRKNLEQSLVTRLVYHEYIEIGKYLYVSIYTYTTWYLITQIVLK